MADKQTIVREGSTAAATGTAIGIRIPNVPQAVPVEKLRNAATRKIAAGTAGNHTLNKCLGSKQVAANTGKRPSQNQNYVGGEHQFHTLDGAFHKVMERNDAARNIHDECNA